VERASPERIVLFGSRARGSYEARATVGVTNSATVVSYKLDELERVFQRDQLVGSDLYSSTVGWAPSGVRTVTLPSGRVITYGTDAVGRVTGVTGVKGAEARTYVSGGVYAAHGALKQWSIGGTAQTEVWSWNARLQPVTIRHGTGLDLSLGYCAGGGTWCGANQGGVVQQKLIHLGSTQDYTYTARDELATASEVRTAGGQSCWAWGFGHSATANQWVETNAGLPLDAVTPTGPGWFNGNNRLVNAGIGIGYDPAGNQTQVGAWTFDFDGEGRLKAATMNGNTVTYSYDGEGRRVKSAPPGGTATVFAYNALGELAAEYGPASGASGVQFVGVDWLGSTRTVTDATGAVVSRHDYAPTGKEIPAGLCGRESGNFYGAAGPRVKFTGKEREGAEGDYLDYFGARYLAWVQGRFTSPDPPLLDQHIEDPQSWNLYAYGRNNPLRYIDPTGNAIELLGDEEQRKKELALLQKSLGNDKAASRVYINEVKDGDNTRYFVAIKGDVGSFMKMGETSHDLANLVEHKNVVEFGLTSQNLGQFGGAVTYEKGEVGNANIRVLVNPDQMGITNRNLSPSSILGMSRWEGQDQRPRWNVNDFTPGLAAWHEFGHAWGFINGRPGSATNPEALQWENRMREQLYGPLGPRNARRIRH
jgi:RHS repeat-associated protein